ncbi:MAG: cobalt-precorrin-6A reductase [Fibrobacterota bacterium]
MRIARALLAAGHAVLVSQATEIALPCPVHPSLRLRRGRMDKTEFVKLIRSESIEALIDASHPFAVELHATLAQASHECGIPRLRYERPAPELPSDAQEVPDHEEAARRALVPGAVVALTTGSRTLELYSRLATERGATLWARIADSQESRTCAARAGIPPERLLWARGPFSVEDTCTFLRQSGASVLVAKDSGHEGGILERIEACRRTGVKAMVVSRPPLDPNGFSSAQAILAALERMSLRSGNAKGQIRA